MTSRSVARRLSGRRVFPVRGRTIRNVRDWTGLVRVAVRLTSADGNLQSFLIMPGTTYRVTLTGYVVTGDGPKVLAVPVDIAAVLS